MEFFPSLVHAQREQLPIFKYRDQILYALETHRVVIIGNY
jgi:HrpA-like RNA helicase